MESCSPDGFNQPFVTTRLKEKQVQGTIRVRDETKYG